ncbi:MAG: sulfatase, partial [Thermomicrobiales bacterium]|nr:sulfatase [Thermomicrobiales bacterium]
NIVLILTDDMRVSDLAYLPAVQSLLVEQGATFTNFATTTPGCAPARASILRGQYPHNHGVRRGSGDHGGIELFRTLGNEDSTIATWLQDAGYRTGLVGKYLNGYGSSEEMLAIPPGWSDWHGVSNEGYSRFTLNENGEEVRYNSRKEEQHLTNVLAEKAQEFIAATAPTGQPFFLHVSTRAPHGPAEPASWYQQALPGLTLPRTDALNEADVSDKPNWVRILPLLTDAELAALDAKFRARLQTLLSVDDLVATLVEELAEQGVLESTYIIFSSDNGYSLGEHRIFEAKGSPYEEAIMAPLVIRGPGIAPGQTLDVLASQVDLAPTFAEWGGAAIPAFVDGRSLAAILRGEGVPADWREVQLVEHFVANGDRTHRQPAFEALRNASMIYVAYGTGEEELYDVVADPHEVSNQAAAAAPELLAELRARTEAMYGCAGETCRTLEQKPLPTWP